METLPALAVERLSIPEAYRIGRVLRFVGFILDQEQQRIEIGERAHRLAARTLADASECGPPIFSGASRK